MQWTPLKGISRPLRADQAWKASITAVVFRAAPGALRPRGTPADGGHSAGPFSDSPEPRSRLIGQGLSLLRVRRRVAAPRRRAVR